MNMKSSTFTRAIFGTLEMFQGIQMEKRVALPQILHSLIELRMCDRMELAGVKPRTSDLIPDQQEVMATR